MNLIDLRNDIINKVKLYIDTKQDNEPILKKINYAGRFYDSNEVISLVFCNDASAGK